nr:MAG: hypothetical protein [Microvirus Sku126]
MMEKKDNNLLKAERPVLKLGLFIKINFINSFNKVRNDAETQKAIEQQVQGD